METTWKCLNKVNRAGLLHIQNICRQIDRQTDRQMDRWTDKKTDTRTDKQVQIDRYTRQTDILKTDKQIGKQADIQTDRQTDRQTARQTDQKDVNRQTFSCFKEKQLLDIDRVELQGYQIQFICQISYDQRTDVHNHTHTKHTQVTHAQTAVSI